MKLMDMTIGTKYVVTKGSRDTLNKGDHVEMFQNPWGELCIACKEAGGWLQREDWQKLTRVEVAPDVETMYRQLANAEKLVEELKGKINAAEQDQVVK